MDKFFAGHNAKAVHKICARLRLAIWDLDFQQLEKRSISAYHSQIPLTSGAGNQCARTRFGRLFGPNARFQDPRLEISKGGS
jgi:hypothetical protein